MNKELIYRIPESWDPVQCSFMLCPGCQHGVAGKLLADVVDELGVEGRSVVIGGAGCNAGVYGGLELDGTLIAHGKGSEQATAIKRLYPDSIVFAVFGDGDCAAIGIDSLIAALNRAEKFTVFMLNNAEYASTGGQIAPTTLIGQSTPTSPGGRTSERDGFPMKVAELVAQFRGAAYSARGALNTPANYSRTRKYVKTALQKQMDGAGFSFVEILCACPTQWHLSPLKCLDWIEDKLIPEYPLGEFKNIDRVE
ncbi:MAG: thiamine pyrophosphate-dependent enzyme [Chloroflexota bacterium]|nr:thiamine pyrophosphate-dependent enzyme [Chloroflexota bacterium]